MLAAGIVASLKIGSVGGGKGYVERSFAVQVRFVLLPFGLGCSGLSLDLAIDSHDNRDRQLSEKFTVEAGVTPCEPSPWMGCSW